MGRVHAALSIDVTAYRIFYMTKSGNLLRTGGEVVITASSTAGDSVNTPT